MLCRFSIGPDLSALVRDEHLTPMRCRAEDVYYLALSRKNPNGAKRKMAIEVAACSVLREGF